MRRSQGAALAGVVLLLAGAFVVRAQETPERPGSPDLAPLREATALAPCPPGLGPELPDLVAFAQAAGDRVGLVGVLTPDAERNGLEFARQMSMRYPSAMDARARCSGRSGRGHL